MQVLRFSLLVSLGISVQAAPSGYLFARQSNSTQSSNSTAAAPEAAASSLPVATPDSVPSFSSSSPAPEAPMPAPSSESAPPPPSSGPAPASIPTTHDSWESTYGCDSWFSTWYNKQVSLSLSVSLKSFYTQYGLEWPGCVLGQPCDLLSHVDWSSHHIPEQAYLVLSSYQNLHDMFSLVHQSFFSGDVSLWSHISEVATSFHSMHPEYSYGHHSSWDIAPVVWGAWSHFINVLGNGDIGYAHHGGYLDGFHGIMQSISSVSEFSSSVKFGHGFSYDVSQTQEFFATFTSELSTSLETLYGSIFEHGDHITDIFSHGGWVDRHALNLDCHHCVSDVQNWFVTHVTAKMVNFVWQDDNVFITYMPYGKVAEKVEIDILSKNSYSPSWSHFSYDDCMSHSHEAPSFVYCYQPDAHFGWNGWGPGMARLVYYNPQYSSGYSSWGHGSIGSVDLTHQPYGWDGSAYHSFFTESVQSTWKFSVTDIIQSSVSGFDIGGYNYDHISTLASQFTSVHTETITKEVDASFTNFWDISPATPGFWSLPVCIINDWNAWPSVYGHDSHAVGLSLCQCQNSVDLHGVSFIEAVGPSLSQLSSHYGWEGGSWNQCTGHAWGPNRYVPPPSGHHNQHGHHGHHS